MKRLLTTLVILTGLIGSGGAAWADDSNKGYAAYQAGDYAEALKWWRKAAEQGNATGQTSLGFMYEKGKGVTQDYAEAAKWFRKAAEQGNAFAQSNLGVAYDKGDGVTQDYAEAVKWFRKAAEQGLAVAQFNLGLKYAKGEGVLQEMVAAHMWFNIAAANGNKGAVKDRDIAAGMLSSSGVEEAQKRAKRCMSSGYKDCD
jgi:TPR repeat protein